MANANNGRFVWYEHITKDPKAAIAFYSDVIGWQTQPFGEGNSYTMWVGSQGPLGGVIELPEQAAKMGTPPHWMGHVQVENVDATAALVKELGGQIHHGPEDIPTVGRFAVIADPQGAFLSIFQPSGDMMTLHDSSKPGEFCWSELVTSDSAAAFAFYAKLFGWKAIEEMNMGDMGTYRIFGLGDVRVGGMMTAPKGSNMPAMWGYYTQVSNLDVAVERATKRGAKVINGPMEVPGGARIAQLLDSQGAVFALHYLPATSGS
jgi:predicted enzyme related to lactoylglutathione lyase